MLLRLNDIVRIIENEKLKKGIYSDPSSNCN